jgi:uncharacterized protein
MLVVRTYVAPSRVHGLGVFARHPLRAGTLVWVFDPVIDQVITRDQLAALPDTVRDIALSRSFVSKNGQTILSRDNGVFLNHSERPNIAGESSEAFALRDIAMDEELTEDYRLLPFGACRAFLDEPLQSPPSRITQPDHPARSLVRVIFEGSHQIHVYRSRWLRYWNARAAAERS